MSVFHKAGAGESPKALNTNGTPRRTSRDLQKEETRQRVYEAALEIFRRDGVAACRIEDIASLAGVSRGTFYFHFPTKEDVLAQLIRESQGRTAATLEALPEDADLATVLTTVGESLNAVWQNDAGIFPDVAVVALRLASPMPESESMFRIRSLLAKRFSRARGELTELASPEMLADLFLVNQFAAALAWTGNQSVSLRDALTGASFLFLHGAGKGGPAG